MELILFWLKKIAGLMLFPVGMGFVLWLAGLVLWLARPGRRWGPALVAAAGLAVFLAASPLTGWLMLHPLESAAGPRAQPAELAPKGVATVVVLSGSYHPHGATPAARCGASTLLRVMEGVRLWKGLKGARLVMSGGSHQDGKGPSQPMQEVARQLGVPAGAMAGEAASWDTEGQARALAPLLGNRPFALVTQASHMSRALMIFRSYGMTPLPAPCDFITGPDFTWEPVQWLPQVRGLGMTERACYEYLGKVWYGLKLWVGASPAALSAAPSSSQPSSGRAGLLGSSR